jgi:hypothetical protein
MKFGIEQNDAIRRSALISAIINPIAGFDLQ